MAPEYKNNHYVPQWYQKRFLPSGQRDQELYYLDLKPGEFVDPRGIAHPKRAIHRQGFKHCFAAEDLYTRFGQADSTAIEKHFFGEIDRKANQAVEFFARFNHSSFDGDAFNDLLIFMSTQKLRTPKGLEWLANLVRTRSQEDALEMMLSLRQLYCAIWTECIWLIADASHSDTKFIISDHPVTVYNRRCGPRSQWCKGANDPDIRYHGTHTIFPLSLEKILILTNLSWVRNPYQSETGVRPNPELFRGAIFHTLDVQILRHLNEQEVREINFIIKSRARRYIGAAKEEWLFPDKDVSKSQWNTFGHGYLLMPDPRAVAFTGELFVGFKDGRSTGVDPYGRRPWEPNFGKEAKEKLEFKTLYQFKGEFARLFGPLRRGRSLEFGELGEERDSDSLHEYHLSLDKGKGKR